MWNAAWTTGLEEQRLHSPERILHAPGPNRRSQHAAWTAIGVPMERGGQDNTENPGFDDDKRRDEFL